MATERPAPGGIVRMSLDKPPRFDGTMYIDDGDESVLALFDEVVANDGPTLGLGSVEDVGYIYESPTIVMGAQVFIGERAIRAHFQR